MAYETSSQEEFYEYAADLEKEWRKSLPKFTDKELLVIFPEAKQIIPEKIKEWNVKKESITDVIKRKLALIKNNIKDELSMYFWREWIKINEGVELFKTEKQLARLKRLSFSASGKTTKSVITEERIQQALAVPTERLYDRQLKRSGKTLVGLCPFHNEKHPSFYIYPETNSYYCFGCNQGGNAINFIRTLYGYSFKEAVKYLTN